MVLRATGTQHVKIFGLKLRITLFIDSIERIYQTVAKSIGINIEWGMHEMGDIGPKSLIAIHEFKSRPEAFTLHAHPNRIDLIWCELPLGTGRMQLALKIIKGNLAHHGVDHVLHFAGQEYFTLLRCFSCRQKFAKCQHFAKNGSGLCQGERC